MSGCKSAIWQAARKRKKIDREIFTWKPVDGRVLSEVHELD